jgi:hypothetical protein
LPRILDRTFGCEFEFSTMFSDIKPIALKCIENVYGEDSNWVKISKETKETHNNLSYWHVKPEPTSASEICTPISTMKDMGKIKRVVKNFKKNNIEVSDSDSMHVHIYAGDIDIKLLLAIWIRFEAIIKRWFPRSRYQSYSYNEPVINYKGNAKKVADFLLESMGDDLGYKLISFNSHCKRKTVEFRISEGTLNPDHVYAWVKMCLIIVNRVKTADVYDSVCSSVNNLSKIEFIDYFKIRDKKILKWMDDRENEFKRKTK